MIRSLTAGAALVALAAPAHAHAFRTGADAYAQFLEGTGVPLGDPAILLGLLPLGVLLGLWRMDGMPAVWPGFIAGLMLGLGLAPALPEGITLVPLAIGLIAAILGAAALNYPRLPLTLFAGLTGAAAGATALSGHGWGELPPTIHAGVFLGTHLAVVLPAALVVTTRQAIDAGWLRLGWRITASWLGAMAMMFGAFQIAPA
ncbi:MAG: hypothetical protein ACE368_07460 [Paracoccaceae bacterium]